LPAEPLEDARRIRVHAHCPIPALLLGVENLVQQLGGQVKPGLLPGGPVNVLVGDLILARALDVALERHEDIAQ
jgi:hypothetical protein